MYKILLANSDPKLTQIYAWHMRDNFLVDSARNGLAAMRQIRVLRPHLIVSDYHLPLLSGISLLRFVRNHHELHSTPFIFLSGHHDNSEALSLGANDWLDIKFCTSENLFERVIHHLKTNRFNS